MTVPTYAGDGDPLVVAALVALYGAWRVGERVAEWRAPGPVERARERYAAGELTLTQFEREVELHDDRTREMREALEEVSGVGEETSAAVALKFSSLDELRRVDVDELAERVHGVGPSTARALQEDLGGVDR